MGLSGGMTSGQGTGGSGGGGGGGVPPVWLVGTTYQPGQIVTGSNGTPFVCVAGDNLGNDPTLAVDTTQWTPLYFDGGIATHGGTGQAVGAAPWNASATYGIGAVVSAGGTGYISVAAANVNHDPGLDDGSHWQIVTAYNNASEFVLLDGTGKLPAVDGSLLTGLLPNPMTTLGDLITAGPSDLALTGTASAVNGGGGTTGSAANINDGNDATFCMVHGAGYTAGGYFTIDLGSPYAAGTARVLQGDGGIGATTTRWKLQGSNDNITYTDLVTAPATTDDQTLSTGTSTAYRYWRIVGTTSTLSDYWAVYTFALIVASVPVVRLGAGSNGQALVVASGSPAWAGAVAWTDVVGGVGFQNSWVDAGGANAKSGFRKDATGRVDFRVSAKSGASSSVMFTFPAGYRPAASQTFTGQAELVASDVPVELLVASGGTATITFVGSLTGNVYCTGTFWNGQ